MAVAVGVVEVPLWLGSGAAGDAEGGLVLCEEPGRAVPGAGRLSGGWAAAQQLGDGVGLFEAGDPCSGVQVVGELVVDRVDFAFELQSLGDDGGGVAFGDVGVCDLAGECGDFDVGVGDVVGQRPD